jgi:hypothetical protein
MPAHATTGVTQAPAPPRIRGYQPPRRFQGYLDERSTHHAAGWMRDLDDPAARLDFELVIMDGATEGGRVIHRGRADAYSHVLTQVGVGDGRYSFHVVFAEPLTEADRDRLVARPVGSAWSAELAPELRTAFEPISHIAMDIVNNCNLRCPFCVYDYSETRTTRFMTEETFASVLRLIPFVTDGNFWLSCLHEATLHPRLLDFIERVPTEYRRKLFYTTNLAKRMPADYFAAIARSGMHHLNISLESLDPARYERFRDGARHNIFAANWQMLLDAFQAAEAAPRIRYNIMAYRSNLEEIPRLVTTLLMEKHAWQVEVRHTYDVKSIPQSFRDSEFLSTEEWASLTDRLRGFPGDRVLLIGPPGGVGYARDSGPPAFDGDDTPPAVERAPRPFNISMTWDGAMRVYGERERGPGKPPQHVNYVSTNILYLPDPLRFLLSL